ncbi:MAG: recombinase family protein [Synergistaceae bacterium]|nr:recombinase family protein [Synergistaceae bacterium]
MAGRKKEKSLAGPANFEIPQDLQDRLQNISERTQLSYQELLQKWLTQEENLADFQRSDDEDFNEGLLKWKEDVDARLGDLQRQVSALWPSAAVGDVPAPKENASGRNTYRRTILRKIRSLRRKGMTFTDIARQFNEEGVATLSGTGKWYSGTISQILSRSTA